MDFPFETFAPVIAIVGILAFNFHWNEFFRSMIYLNDQTKWPLQVVLRQFVIEGDKIAIVGASDDPSRRYKMVMESKHEGTTSVYLGLSPDGIRWQWPPHPRQWRSRRPLQRRSRAPRPAGRWPRCSCRRRAADGRPATP